MSDQPADLRALLADAIEGMQGWLRPEDAAMVGLAEHAAHQIETAAERAREFDEVMELVDPSDRDLMKRLEKLQAMCDVTKVVGWLGPQLQGYLKELGGSPAARKALNEVKKEASGRLKELRADAQR